MKLKKIWLAVLAIFLLSFGFVACSNGSDSSSDGDEIIIENTDDSNPTDSDGSDSDSTKTDGENPDTTDSDSGNTDSTGTDGENSDSSDTSGTSGDSGSSSSTQTSSGSDKSDGTNNQYFKNLTVTYDKTKDAITGNLEFIKNIYPENNCIIIALERNDGITNNFSMPTKPSGRSQDAGDATVTMYDYRDYFTINNAKVLNSSREWTFLDGDIIKVHVKVYDRVTSSGANVLEEIYSTITINKDRYTVTLNSNGGEFKTSDGTTSETSTFEAISNESKTISEQYYSMSREGYTFEGWAKIKDATESEYIDGKIATKEDVTLYAVWAKIAVKKTYIAVDGSLSIFTASDKTFDTSKVKVMAEYTDFSKKDVTSEYTLNYSISDADNEEIYAELSDGYNIYALYDSSENPSVSPVDITSDNLSELEDDENYKIYTPTITIYDSNADEDADISNVLMCTQTVSVVVYKAN